MRCLLCENLSFLHICDSCQELFLTPSIYKRRLPSGVEVISFYKYSDIKHLLHTKHTDLGFYIYKIMAQNSFKKFAKEFTFKTPLHSVAIDDNTKSGYAHTAVLNKELKSEFIKPIHSVLRAQNSVSYSGKDKAFRLLNPRNFRLKEFEAKELILVDDIITTGTTLSEAIVILEQNDKEVLFCLTLCDVSVK